jgi:hypothetical protein
MQLVTSLQLLMSTLMPHARVLKRYHLPVLFLFTCRLQAPPMPLAPSMSSEADQAVAITCVEMKLIAKHACVKPASSSSSSCCLLRAPFPIKSCQPPRSLPVPHACIVWSPGARSAAPSPVGSAMSCVARPSEYKCGCICLDLFYLSQRSQRFINVAPIQAKPDLQVFSSSSMQRQQLPSTITGVCGTIPVF